MTKSIDFTPLVLGIIIIVLFINFSSNKDGKASKPSSPTQSNSVAINNP